MKRIKSVIGILLIILSVAGLFLWEWKGRNVILLEDVLVATKEIVKGTTVDGSMFTTKGVSKDNLLKSALTPEDVRMLDGKVTSQYIAENGQIIMDYFRDDEFCLKPEESVFVIKPDWVDMRSSSLRRGDAVDIYSTAEGNLIGSYLVAFVKDEAEREVRDASLESQDVTDKEILQRLDSTSSIDHIEIIATLGEYEEIVSYTNGATSSALIIVQRGEKLDT